MALIGWKGEGGQAAQEPGGIAARAAVAVDEYPGDADSLVEVGRERVVARVGLDDEDRAPRGLDALGHPVESGQTRDVAGEEVPIGDRAERDLAAGADDVDGVAERGVLDPRAAGSGVSGAHPEREMVAFGVDVAHAVATPHERVRPGGESDHDVVAWHPGERHGRTAQHDLVH